MLVDPPVAESTYQQSTESPFEPPSCDQVESLGQCVPAASPLIEEICVCG
jgi:hypothetical protein